VASFPRGRNWGVCNGHPEKRGDRFFFLKGCGSSWRDEQATFRFRLVVRIEKREFEPVVYGCDGEEVKEREDGVRGSECVREMCGMEEGRRGRRKGKRTKRPRILNQKLGRK
jgi:hypothetical protein